MKKDGCLFCSVAAGDIPADVVGRGERVLAFRDIAPVAPTHVLVIPLDHYDDIAELAAADRSVMADVISMATDVARSEGLDGTGYRVVFNTGADGGQTVHHLHAHVLGGRKMTWPPG